MPISTQLTSIRLCLHVTCLIDLVSNNIYFALFYLETFYTELLTSIIVTENSNKPINKTYESEEFLPI